MGFRHMDTMKKAVDYNQPGARERSVEMLATAVARLVNRCECMDTEMRVRFMARLLDHLTDDEAKLPQPANFSLQAAITEHPDKPELALDKAAVLLTCNLRRDQGLSDKWLNRFYDELFAMLLPRSACATASVA
jgi:hypothetical protein